MASSVLSASSTATRLRLVRACPERRRRALRAEYFYPDPLLWIFESQGRVGEHELRQDLSDLIVRATLPRLRSGQGWVALFCHCEETVGRRGNLGPQDRNTVNGFRMLEKGQPGVEAWQSQR